MSIFKKVILSSVSTPDWNNVKNILSNNGIKFYTRVTNHGGKWLSNGTTRARMGSFGEKPEYTSIYELLVDKKDYDKAIYLIKNQD